MRIFLDFVFRIQNSESNGNREKNKILEDLSICVRRRFKRNNNAIKTHTDLNAIYIYVIKKTQNLEIIAK